MGAMDNPIETRYLVAAVILAEELSFTAAAKRLEMSQSGVSRRLNQLEKRCGFRLFDRDNAKVVITEAGQAFLEEAKLSLMHDARAVEHGKAANDGAESQLTIGRSPYLDPAILPALFSIHLPLYPNLNIHMQSDFAPELERGLVTSKLDLALIANPSSNRKITTTKIAEAPFYIAIPENHALASKETLNLGDLRDCTWIVFDRKVHPALHAMLWRRAAEEGLPYRNNQNVLSAEEAVQLVAENIGIAFLTKAGALRAKGNGITVRPLVDNELRVELYLASRADNRSKLVSQFARAFMRRIEQVLAPPQMILPLGESPIGPNEPTPGKHTPKSDHGVDAKPRFKRTAPKL
jgi:DNA-binding transcriptional LysR family regulator